MLISRLLRCLVTVCEASGRGGEVESFGLIIRLKLVFELTPSAALLLLKRDQIILRTSSHNTFLYFPRVPLSKRLRPPCRRPPTFAQRSTQTSRKRSYEGGEPVGGREDEDEERESRRADGRTAGRILRGPLKETPSTL